MHTKHTTKWLQRAKSERSQKTKLKNTMFFKNNKPCSAKIARCLSFQERRTYRLNADTFEHESSLKQFSPVRTKVCSQASALSHTGSVKHSRSSSRRHLQLLVQRRYTFWLQLCIKILCFSIFLWPVLSQLLNVFVPKHKKTPCQPPNSTRC